MKKQLRLLALCAAALVSCHTPLAVASVQPQKSISITSDIAADPVAESIIAPYRAELDQKMNAKISYTSVDLTRQGDNSPLGNLLADYTLQGAREWAAKNGLPATDAAIINIGGIRSTIGKGDIALKHIFEVMPFENELVLIKMKGSDLASMFDYYLKSQKNNPVANLTIETENGALLRGLVGSASPDPAKTYYIATSDYLAGGGDNMDFFKKGEIISTGVKLRDLYIDKFGAQKEIVPPADERLIFKGKKTQNP